MILDIEKSKILIEQAKEIYCKEGKVSQKILNKYGIHHVERVFSQGMGELYELADIPQAITNQRQSKEFIISVIQKLSQKYGEHLSLKKICTEGKVSRKSFYSYWKKIEDAYEEAGVERYTRRIKPRNEVLQVLKIIHLKEGKVRMKYLQKYGINQRDIERYFSGLEEAMEAANVEYNNLKKGQSKEEVISAILLVNERDGKVTEQTLKSETNQRAIEKYFGSIENACNEAGVDYENKQRQKTREEIINTAIKIYNEFGCIRFSLLRKYYSDGTIFSKFGSLKGLYEAAKLPYMAPKSCLILIAEKILSDIGYQNIKDEISFPWLKYKHKLHIDIYIPELKLAIEVDGPQHSKYVKYFHRKVEGFMRYLIRDLYKDTLCAKHGIRVIRITEDELLIPGCLKKEIDELVKKSL